MASFTRLSPSRMVTICRGSRSRCAIAVAAMASGGETIAPSTRATGHAIPGTSAWTAAATAVVVAMTSPTARSVIEKRFVRKSRHEVKYPAAYRMGGRKSRKTICGSSVTCGRDGTNPSPIPATTRTIGYGTFTLRARNASAVVRTRRVRIVSTVRTPDSRLQSGSHVMSERTAIVAGASGLVGGHCLRRLLASGLARARRRVRPRPDQRDPQAARAANRRLRPARPDVGLPARARRLLLSRHDDEEGRFRGGVPEGRLRIRRAPRGDLPPHGRGPLLSRERDRRRPEVALLLQPREGRGGGSRREARLRGSPPLPAVVPDRLEEREAPGGDGSGSRPLASSQSPSSDPPENFGRSRRTPSRARWSSSRANARPAGTSIRPTRWRDSRRSPERRRDESP